MNEIRDSIHDDFRNFSRNNSLVVAHSSGDIINYMAFVESRISSDIALLSNPNLCNTFGLSQDKLMQELGELIEIRKKVSITDDKRYDRRIR